MRITTSIFLVFIVSLVTFQEATFYVFFKFNQNYFAKNLCVEKEIKGSKCKGHCQLAKMVEQSKETPSPEMPLPTFEPTKIELFILASDFRVSVENSIQQPCFQLSSLREFDFYDSVFHPPVA